MTENKKRKVSKVIPVDGDKVRHREAIGEIDNEIEYLERKLGVRGDQKKVKKLQSQLENEGLGLGFLDFLDAIPAKVKNKAVSKDEYGAFKDYGFNDDANDLKLLQANFE